MILYKSDFDHDGYIFPNVDYGSDIDYLKAYWTTTGAAWAASNGDLAPQAVSSTLFADAGTKDVEFSCSATVNIFWTNITIQLATNATGTEGISFVITKDGLWIYEGSTVKAYQKILNPSITESGIIDITVFKNGTTLYCGVYDRSNDKLSVVSCDKNISIALGTYISVDQLSAADPVIFHEFELNSIMPRIQAQASTLTLANLREIVTEDIQDGGVSTATIDRHINKAYKTIYMSEHWRERKLTSSIVLRNGVSEYLLPVSLGDVGSVRRLNKVLRYEGEKYLEMIYDSGNPGTTPNNVTFNGRTLKVSPSPGEDWDGTLLVCEFYSDITKVLTDGFVENGILVDTTDCPNLHPALHECIAQLATLKLLALLREAGTAPQYMINDYNMSYKLAKEIAFGKDVFPAQIRIMRR